MIKVVTNPDKEFVKEFREQLKNNDGYCPCRAVKTENTKCMCREFREQIERGESGECHCGLYSVVITSE